MRLLCAVGQRDGALVVRSALALVKGSIDLTVLHVVDDRPRRDVERFTGPLRRTAPERQREIAEVEASAGQAALAEAEAEAATHEVEALVTSVVLRLEWGKPEHVIVALAHELLPDLVVLRPREHPENFPQIGPPSIGHTARFVVDHAPCPVLLLRGT